MNGISKNKEYSTEQRKPRSRNKLLAIAGLVAFGVAFHSSLAFADKNARPFKASFEAVPVGDITVVGGGNATHLGKFDLEIQRMASGLPSPEEPCVSFEFIIVTMIAANGDELWMAYTDGELCFDLSNFPILFFAGEANFVGTGGTGRFSGSTGEYQMRWSGEITPFGVSNTGVLEGVIGY